jgi:hypothetical protein
MKFAKKKRAKMKGNIKQPKPIVIIYDPPIVLNGEKEVEEFLAKSMLRALNRTWKDKKS